MMHRERNGRGACRLGMTLAVGLAIGFGSAPAHAAVPGFVEDFTSGLGGFGGGSQSYTNPGSGGVGGAGDGFLEIGNSSAQFLGGRSTSPVYTGDLRGDGVHAISFYLKDTGADDDVSIYVGVGQAFVNFWVSGPFIPEENSWTKFSVNLFNEANWTQIIGSGSFDDAVANSDRLLFRHDVAPIARQPDAIAAEFGVDRITLIPTPGAVAAMGLAGLGLASRRRRA